MKKLMVLAAVAALASGAWAEDTTYDYAFNAKIYGMNGAHFQGDTGLYLIDTSSGGNGTIIGYVRFGDGFNVDNGIYTLQSTKERSSGSLTVDGVTYSLAAQKLTSATLSPESDGSYSFKGGVTTTGPAAIDGNVPYPKNLKVVVWSEAWNTPGDPDSGLSGQTLYSQTVMNTTDNLHAINVGFATAGQGTESLSVSAAMTVTPEPTSALLLLLGVAGLALKRKQA